MLENRALPLAVFLALGLILCGCSDEPAATADSTADPHAGHDHGPGGHDTDGDDPAGLEDSRHDLGSKEIGAFSVVVAQVGDVVAGGGVVVELAVTGEGTPDAVRLWIGDEKGMGSTKSKAHAHGGAMDGHVEVPDPLPEGSMLWIEVETADGKERASFTYGAK